jgi:Ca-activated chloride channel family protein
MRLGHLTWWWLAVLPVLATGLWVYGSVTRRKVLERVGHAPMVQKLLMGFSPERRMLKRLLTGLALVLVTVAVLRPQLGARPKPLKRTGIDIAIAFDISKSMLAQDVQPSRIEGAREELRQLLEAVQGDRVALVPFAGVAFTQSPLTADNSAIRLYMDSLDPQKMPVGGTNLAMALQESLRLLTGRGDAATAEQPDGAESRRSKVILLITDGEDVRADQGEAAKEAARKAAEGGVRIFAVGVGTRLGEPIPLYDSSGEFAGYQENTEGKKIVSKLNLTLLEELVDLADPENPDEVRVWHHDGTEALTPQVVAALGSLQKATIATTIRHAYGEKFQYALLPALLLLLGDLLVGERRRRRRT